MNVFCEIMNYENIDQSMSRYWGDGWSRQGQWVLLTQRFSFV